MTATWEVMRQAEQRLSEIVAEIKALQRVQRVVGADVEAQKPEIALAWELLTEIMISDLQPTTLQELVRRIPVTALAPTAVAQRRATIFNEAQARLLTLVADPGLTNAEATLNEVDIGVADLDVSIAPLRASTLLLETAPLFLDLLSWRYGTDEYALRFWQLDYYRHWKHGDLVVEAHGPRLKKTEFKSIAALYVEELQALNTLLHAHTSLLDKKRTIETLRQQIVDTQRIIADVDSVVLKNARSRLKDYLRVLPEHDVFRVLQGDEAAVLAYKRVVGIAKKQEYLQALNDQQVKTSLGDLQQMKNKLIRTHGKLARPKNDANKRWSSAEVQQMIGQDRTEKWNKRRAHYDNARTHVVEFHHYDRYDPYSTARDLLWWDVMTDGQLDGNFIDEVRERGPSQYRHEPSTDVQPGWRSDDLSDVS